MTEVPGTPPRGAPGPAAPGPGEPLPAPTGGAAGKLGTLVGGVVASKLLGVARELLLAFAFGTTFVTDAFRIALSAVLIPTHLLTGEALFSAFVPTYRRLSEGQGLRLVRTVGTALVGLSLILAALLIVLAPLIARALAPGFDEPALRLCGRLIRIAAAGVVFYSVSAMLINLQVARDRYVSYAMRPGALNVGILAFVAAAYVWEAPTLLGLGFVAAFVVLTAWCLHEVRDLGVPLAEIFRPVLRWDPQVTSEFRGAMGALALFVLVAQLSAAVDRLVASLTGEGGVAALEYAFFVTDSARAVIALPLATLALGRLGGASWSRAAGAMERAMGVLLVVTLGLSVLLWSVSSDLVTVLYQRGEFRLESTRLTTASLEGFAVGVWATTAGYLLVRLFNVTLRNREVAAIGAVGLLANIVLDLALYRPLGVFGIALATSASAALSFGLLAYRSGLAGPMLRKTALPGAAMLALAAVLPPLSGAGLASLALAGLTTLGWTVLVCAVWRPLREDAVWLLRRARAAEAGDPEPRG